jgi:hypothetical protein
MSMRFKYVYRTASETKAVICFSLIGKLFLAPANSTYVEIVMMKGIYKHVDKKPQI